MSAVADYRTKILALLNDPSLERFTTAQVDAALTFTVEDYSRYRPLVRTYTIDSSGEQRIVLPVEFSAFSVVRVEWLRDQAQSDEIKFYTYMQDENWILETPGLIIPLGEVITLTYYAMHTVDGLASAAGTTIPDSDEDLVVLGAAGEAARSRSVSKVETNNLNPGEATILLNFALNALTQFQQKLGVHEMSYMSASWADKDIDKAF